MQILVVSGHLTPTEKTHIKSIIQQDKQNATVNTKTYAIEKMGNNFKVKISQPDNSIVIGEKISRSSAVFKVN